LGKSATASGYVGYSLGSVKQQYVFGVRGSYSYRMEGWGGHARPDEWQIIEEFGTYTASGDQLTLTRRRQSGRCVERRRFARPSPCRWKR